MGRTEKSEVTVFCEGSKSKTRIPLNLLRSQSTFLADACAPPIDNVVFEAVYEPVLKDVLHFCRFQTIKSECTDLELLTQFANGWQMKALMKYLDSIKGQNPIQAANNPLINVNNQQVNTKVNDDDSLFHSQFKYASSARDFDDGIRVFPITIVIPAGGASFKLQIVNSCKSRLAFTYTCTNSTEYHLENEYDFVEPFSVTYANVTRLTGMPCDDQLTFIFARANAKISNPKTPFKSGYPTTKITVDITTK